MRLASGGITVSTGKMDEMFNSESKDLHLEEGQEQKDRGLSLLLALNVAEQNENVVKIFRILSIIN